LHTSFAFDSSLTVGTSGRRGHTCMVRIPAGRLNSHCHFRQSNHLIFPAGWGHS